MPDDANPPTEEAAPAAAEGPPAPWRRWAPLAVAVVLASLLFFALPPLTRSGLWDPYELNVADLSRRIAYNLYHAGLSLIHI